MTIRSVYEALRILKEITTHNYRGCDVYRDTVKCTLCDHSVDIFNTIAHSKFFSEDDIKCDVVSYISETEAQTGEYAICNSEEEFV